MEEIPTWFPGAKLNYAENLLYRRDDAIALTEAGESGVVIHITYKELHQRVRVMAAALRVNGLKVGDRVAGRNHVLLAYPSLLTNSPLQLLSQIHLPLSSLRWLLRALVVYFRALLLIWGLR